MEACPNLVQIQTDSALGARKQRVTDVYGRATGRCKVRWGRGWPPRKHQSVHQTRNKPLNEMVQM